MTQFTRPKLKRSNLRAQRGANRLSVFQLSCEVYSWTRSILALTGLLCVAVTLLAPSSSLSFGTFHLTPTAGQPMSCSAVEGMRSTWVCHSLQGSVQGSSSGGISLTQ